ncbi:unnamed protein product, partial [marine sediment metagenome]
FVHVGWGRWQLAGWAAQPEPPEHEPKAQREVVVINDEIWNAVTTIEENDYVYKLLEKIRKPLSFDEICSRLADYLKVDVYELRATGFLKAYDERFRRLDNGSWALEKWFEKPSAQKPEPEQPPNVLVKPKKSFWTDKFWLILKNLVVSVKRYYSRFFNLIFRK